MKQPPIKTKELYGSTVQIADGQNWEIASITAYGENAQGGTTEDPVALTGISSVTVNDDVTELPIPRPLRRVGDVKDKCVTRVKSVYDKRIVLDGSEAWVEYTDENWQGAGYHVYRFYDADALPSQYIVSNKYPSRRGASNFKGTLGVTSGAQSILFSVVEQKTVDDWKAYLSAQKAAGTPLIIYRQSTAYNGTNGLDVCLTEYQNGFVELDGTENVMFQDYGNFKRLFLDLNSSALSRYSLEFSHGEVGAIPTIAGGLAASFNEANLYRLQILGAPDTWTTLGVTDTTTAKTWLAAQKTAGTPVQVAYQLATPEVYATDPIDFDNAAGPLTVMTGGEVEVTLTHRMLTPYTAWTIQYDSEGEYTGDFFNVEDYDRIKQNIEYLREYAYFLYGGFTLRGMAAVTVESYGYASTIDALDANLEAIAANTFRPPNMLPVKQWRGNQPPPRADDWNRIENTCLLLFEQFERQFACLPKLAFELKGSAF